MAVTIKVEDTTALEPGVMLDAYAKLDGENYSDSGKQATIRMMVYRSEAHADAKRGQMGVLEFPISSQGVQVEDKVVKVDGVNTIVTGGVFPGYEDYKAAKADLKPDQVKSLHYGLLTRYPRAINIDGKTVPTEFIREAKAVLEEGQVPIEMPVFTLPVP